ncbi:hypothetical protein CEN45_05040 [Fischerella thermalis CCMEE 5198]|nr:hypothetical protein CEN45_05040 [Fischerella thermalis CCMEE 5198]
MGIGALGRDLLNNSPLSGLSCLQFLVASPPNPLNSSGEGKTLPTGLINNKAQQNLFLLFVVRYLE